MNANSKKRNPDYLRAAIALFVLFSFMITAVTAILMTPQAAAACDGVEIAVPIGDIGTCIGDSTDDSVDNPIFIYLRGIVQFLAAGVGAVVTLMIVISGVQYIAASGSMKGAEKGGSPEGIKAAKKKLAHALEALILFLFMAAIANFVIPGGIV